MVDWEQLRKMEAAIVPGIKVVTAPVLDADSTRGMSASPEVLARRKPAQAGAALSPVPGYGGDVWWVVHEGAARIIVDDQEQWDPKDVAPYVLDELRLA